MKSFMIAFCVIHRVSCKETVVIVAVASIMAVTLSYQASSWYCNLEAHPRLLLLNTNWRDYLNSLLSSILDCTCSFLWLLLWIFLAFSAGFLLPDTWYHRNFLLLIILLSMSSSAIFFATEEHLLCSCAIRYFSVNRKTPNSTLHKACSWHAKEGVCHVFSSLLWHVHEMFISSIIFKLKALLMMVDELCFTPMIK